MAELGNSVIRGSLRVINGIHGDLVGSAMKIKATAGTGKYYLVGTLGQNATDANSIAYENTGVYINGATLYATALSGSLAGSNITGTLPVATMPAEIPWAKMANNSSGKVAFNGSTFTVSGNLEVTGTTTFTAQNNLKIYDAMIELYGRSGSAAITSATGMFVRAYNGTNSGFLGMMPQSTMVSRYSGYATDTKKYFRPVFLNGAAYDSSTENVTYAASDIMEILTDLNLNATNDSNNVTADNDSTGYYQVRKGSAGLLYVGPINWRSYDEKAWIYVSQTSGANADVAGSNPWINLWDNVFRDSMHLIGSGATSVSADSNRNLYFSSTDYHVQATSSDGTYYLAGPAAVASPASSNVGVVLYDNAAAYVSNKILHETSAIDTDTLDPHTSGGTIKFNSDCIRITPVELEASGDPTTRIEKAGDIYEHGHRPFPMAVVDSGIF